MQNNPTAKLPVLILCALLMLGLLPGMAFEEPTGKPVSAARYAYAPEESGLSRESDAPESSTTESSSTSESDAPESSTTESSSTSESDSIPADGSVPPASGTYERSPSAAQSPPDSDDSRPPLRAGPGAITVIDVAQGGLSAAVTAANGGSTDFSSLRELHVSGTLNTSDLYFLQGLYSLQTLDLAGCGVSAMNAIPGGLFANHVSLVTVTMPGKGGYSMPSNLFAGCTALVSADVSRAASFGSSVFSGCSGLQTPIMPASYTIGNSMFANCTSLASFDASKAVAIGGSAFSGCTALASVNLGGTQKTIQDYAFYGCSALAGVNLPAGSRLGNYAFANSGLTSVNLAGVTLMGSGTFWNCTALQSFTLTADANLPAYSFGNCTALASANLTGFRSFGEGAFSGCSSLQSVALPDRYALAPSLFQNCRSLRFVDLSGTSSIPQSTFASCLSLQEVRMPAAPYTIGNNAFTGCENLEHIDLSGATAVGSNAFNTCRHLYDITWPAGGIDNAALGNYAFALTAQDFSKGFPAGSGLTDANVTRVAPSQTPRVYFMLPNGDSGTVPQGEVFGAPYRLETQYGTEYAEMCVNADYDSWRVVGLESPDVTPYVNQGGVSLPGVDTNIPGTYAITYTIPGETFSNTHSLDYTLTVLPMAPSSSSQDSTSVSSGGSSGSTPSSASSSEGGGSSGSAPSSVASSEGGGSSGSAPSSVASSEGGGSSVPTPSSGASSRGGGSSSSEATPGKRPDFDGKPAAPVAVGEEFTLMPTVAEKLRQDGWTWERDYLECRIDDGLAHCRAIRPGATYVAYTMRSGYLFRVEITITHKTHCWLWLLLLLLLLLAGGALGYYLWRRSKRQHKTADDKRFTWHRNLP